MSDYRTLEELLDGAIRPDGERVAVCECAQCGGPVILPAVLEVMTLEELKREYPLEEAGDGEGQGLADNPGGQR